MRSLMRTNALAITAAALLSAPVPAWAGNITVKGSDTMVILAQRWAETYMKKHPDVTIQVTGGGSGTGIAALINKTTTLANSQPADQVGRDRESQRQRRRSRRVQSCARRARRSCFTKTTRSRS